jgi:hypothetical protein
MSFVQCLASESLAISVRLDFSLIRVDIKQFRRRPACRHDRHRSTIPSLRNLQEQTGSNLRLVNIFHHTNKFGQITTMPSQPDTSATSVAQSPLFRLPPEL